MGVFMFGTSPVFTITIIIFYVLGLICAAIAILRSRTPQGAIAWVLGLITLPFFTVPIFFIFGRSKFYGYKTRRKLLNKKISRKLVQMQDGMNASELTNTSFHPLMSSLTKLCRPGFTTQNKIDLLIDGKKTYASMLAALDQAQTYIIFQFYVFRTDSTGRIFAELLMKKARQGVRVNFLYDEIGTEISSSLITEMKEAGISVCHFNSLRGKGRFQINFRNHRKILIVDGKVAFVGGLNIGDDYIGLSPSLGPWRDTHVRMEGPSVIACQLTHAKDWYWCSQEDLEADWKIRPSSGEANVLVLPSGPADDKQSCLLAHIAMINSAS
jgi:cardiolipin synthase